MSISALPAQLQNFSLSGAGSSIGDTVLNLKSFKDINGVNLTMSIFGSIGYGTIEPGNGTQEEQISFTGITQNSDGTAQLTGVKHVLFKTPFTETSGMTVTHPGSVVFIISNTSGFENAIYTYINNAVIGGGVPATGSVQGITTLTQDPTSLGSPIAVGANTTISGTSINSSTNKVVDQLSLATTSTNNAVVQANASGKIDTSFITGVAKFGGTGSDGALSISSGTTTIDLGNAALVTKNYTSVSITGTAKLAFINPNANGTLIVIKSQGNVAITSSNNPAIDLTQLGGSGGTAGSSGSAASTTGSGGGGGASINANGNSGTAGSSTQATAGTGGAFTTIMPFSITETGGGGGASGVGGSAGTIIGVNTSAIKYIKLYNYPGSGGGGGQGAGSGGGNVSGHTGGSGGGALTIECAGALNITGIINASGSSGTNSADQGGAGGGGGAGSIVILYNTLTANTGTYTVSAGGGGTASGTGKVGGAGGAGFSLVTLNTEIA